MLETLTIYTTEVNRHKPGYFGKGRWGGIIDFAINTTLDYLQQTEPYKYAELPPIGNAKISGKKKFISNASYSDSKLQTNFRRRASKSYGRNQYCSQFPKRDRQLRRPNRFQQRSSYRRQSYVRFSNGNFFQFS